MRIGIFAHAPCPQASNILKRVSGRGDVEGLFFDMALHPPTTVSLNASGIYWDGHDLTGLDIAYIHGFAFMTPVVPSADTGTDWSVWQADYLVEQQKYSFLLSLFKELDRRGVPLVNPPDAHVLAFMKPALLERLRRSGFSVPDLLCSNDLEEVDAFCERHETVLWRPASGRAAWQLFQEKQKRHLIRKDAPPVLLARCEDGPLRRGYFYEGRALLELSYQPPREMPPESLERFSHVEDPEGGWDPAGLHEASGARWAMALFVKGKDRTWIYDMDPDPILDWLPGPYREHLAQGLALALAGKEERPALTPQISPPLERPLFFLRRMLRILFDFERSKYPEPKQEDPPA